MGIGGNMTGIVQVRSAGRMNKIKEMSEEWKQCMELEGWLDLSTGDSERTVFNAKVQESTHIFLCDYVPMQGRVIVDGKERKVVVTSENARMVIDGLVYDVLLVDNPMNMNEHLEIYLKFVGGQNGC